MKRETTPNPQVNLPPESLRMPSPVETGGLADIEGSYRPPHSPALRTHQGGDGCSGSAIPT
jgi:hypothetical protein